MLLSTQGDGAGDVQRDTFPPSMKHLVRIHSNLSAPSLVDCRHCPNVCYLTIVRWLSHSRQEVHIVLHFNNTAMISICRQLPRITVVDIEKGEKKTLPWLYNRLSAFPWMKLVDSRHRVLASGNTAHGSISKPAAKDSSFVNWS